MRTAILLTISNLFMTIAWYFHLKPEYKKIEIWKIVLISWGIAFFEYCFQVPANRIGSNDGMTASQLKILQEMITLIVFCLFATLYLGEKLKWNHFVGLGLVMAAVFFVNHKWE